MSQTTGDTLPSVAFMYYLNPRTSIGYVNLLEPLSLGLSLSHTHTHTHAHTHARTREGDLHHNYILQKMIQPVSAFL